jgi:hypothetical protein
VESAQPAGAFWQIQCAARGTYLQNAEHCLRTNFGRRAKEKAGAAKDMTTDYKERIRKVAAALLRRKAIPAERRPKREGKPSTEFVETVFTYDGHWTPGAKCGLQIFPGTDGIPVVVLTELPDNVNTSVTNLIECIAAEVVEQYIPARIGSRPPFHCVEHYYPTESIPDETFDLVAFEFDTPQRQVGDDYGIRVSPEAIICLAGEGRLTLGSPRWKRIGRAELEAMIGQPYPEPRAWKSPLAR